VENIYWCEPCDAINCPTHEGELIGWIEDEGKNEKAV
jgi:hypothetical protein